ncbi:UDP-N-acetylmuramoyl-tripeptide--D-alanyl-D-alanine ligase, partial [bacterium]
MGFTLAELRRWIQSAGLDVTARRADGSEAGAAVGALRCRAAVTDSRQVEDGFLFCAAQGDSAHGVDFLEQALTSGAVAALVEGDLPYVDNCATPLFAVTDARAALAAAARGWLDLHQPQVIGITGSNGKTTTKDFLGAALGGEFPVSVSPGNLN